MIEQLSAKRARLRQQKVGDSANDLGQTAG